MEPVQRTEARVISRPSFLSLFVSLRGAGDGMTIRVVRNTQTTLPPLVSRLKKEILVVV